MADTRYNKSDAKRAADSDMSRIEKREARLRASFEAQGGMRGETMRGILAYFTEYRITPRPHLFLLLIERIQELHLLSLPEHRYGVAGGIAAVLFLHPEHEDEWRRQARTAVETAMRLAPPATDAEITRPEHASYLWMQWAVAGDDAAWLRVLRLAQRVDAVGEYTRLLMIAHRSMPEVHEAIEELQSASVPGIQVSWQMLKGTQPPVEQVHELGQLLTRRHDNARAIVFVGWVPVAVPTFLVVTPNGDAPLGCPTTWHGQPVVVRAATPGEMSQYRALLSAKEDV
jgi:hypothetical protein